MANAQAVSVGLGILSTLPLARHTPGRAGGGAGGGARGGAGGEDLSAKMEGVWNTLKGLARHMPGVGGGARGGANEDLSAEMEGIWSTLKGLACHMPGAGVGAGGGDYEDIAMGRDYEANLKQYGDYALEQVLAALQQDQGEGLSEGEGLSKEQGTGSFLVCMLGWPSGPACLMMTSCCSLFCFA